MKKTALFVVVASIVAASVTATTFSPPVANELGFGVDIVPLADLDGFYSCSLAIFDLRSDQVVFEHGITTAEDDANGMVFINKDGTRIDFNCSVNATGTEATYEIRGVRDQAQVISTVATIRLP